MYLDGASEDTRKMVSLTSKPVVGLIPMQVKNKCPCCSAARVIDYLGTYTGKLVKELTFY